MISEDDWQQLKANEHYGMYVALDKRITLIETSIPWLNKVTK